MSSLSTPRSRQNLDCEYHTVDNIEFSVLLHQGGKQTQDSAYMLKLHFMRRNQHLFSLFDGHNGPEISIFARRHFDQQIQQAFLYGDHRMHISLKQAFLFFDEHMQEPKVKEELKKIRTEHGATNAEHETGASTGCEAIVGVIKGKQLHVACLGDSRCLLIRKNQYLALYPNAKFPSEPPKQARSGNIFGGPTNSRTNINSTQAFPFEPSVYAYAIGPEDIALVMFNKTVAKMMDDSSLAQFIKERLDTKSVKEINEEIIQSFLTCRGAEKKSNPKGNLSLMLVKFTCFEGFETG